jgi:signal transduction histidine kinase
MSSRQLLPLIAFATCLLVTLGVMLPVVAVTPYLAAERDVAWLAAASDFRPRRPEAGEAVRDLRTPMAVAARGARQYSLTVAREAVPAGPIGVLVVGLAADALVSINGVRVASEAASASQPLYAGLRRDGLHPGPNRIELIVPAARAYQWPRGFYFGPAPAIRAAWQRIGDIQFVTVRLVAVFGAAAAMLGFLAVAVWPERRLLFVPSILSLIFALWAGLVWLGDAALVTAPQPWAASLLMAAGSVAVLLVAGGQREAWPRAYALTFRVCAAGFGALGAIWVASTWSYDAALLLDHWVRTAVVFLGAGTALVLLCGKGLLDTELTNGQRAVAALLAAALIVAAFARIGEVGAAIFVYGQAFVRVTASLALCVWFAMVAARVFVDLEAQIQKRMGLGRLVREQQAQLKAQQAALESEISRRVLLEERERFSRDIHDGVGGSLVSLLMQARTGQLKEADLTGALEKALDDLRIMIDALDHSRESLAGALATFQTRITPAFAAAGIALEWDQSAVGERTLSNPGSLLQVFRILQEACTNAIKHSKARAATVRVGWDDAAGVFELDVEDDGQGAGNSGGGNGLKNMSYRASKIGGTLSTGPRADGTGWTVRLRVPQQGT